MLFERVQSFYQYHFDQIFLPKQLNIKKHGRHTPLKFPKIVAGLDLQNRHEFAQYNMEYYIQSQNFKVYKILHRDLRFPTD